MRRRKRERERDGYERCGDRVLHGERLASYCGPKSKLPCFQTIERPVRLAHRESFR